MNTTGTTLKMIARLNKLHQNELLRMAKKREKKLKNINNSLRNLLAQANENNLEKVN